MRGLTFRWIWEDVDLVELACTVDTDDFRGLGTCYATREDLSAFASDIESFLGDLKGRVSFATGLDDGTKAVGVEIYAIDLARHTAARVQIVTEPRARIGTTGISRLDTEIAVEPAALQEFAQELHRLHGEGDEAFLRAL
jgi:hypothetical protein